LSFRSLDWSGRERREGPSSSHVRAESIMSEEDEDRGHTADAARGTDAPRALSFSQYQFNFKVGLGARVAARLGGAPAFAQRRARLHRDTASFWSALEKRYRELWTAAQEGRIDEDGRELRHSLLLADGSDQVGSRAHRKRLFSARVDLQEHARAEFNRAWTRQLDHCGISALAREVEIFAKYFPIESGMPMDPETDRFMWMGEPWSPPEAPTAQDVLSRFPLR